MAGDGWREGQFGILKILRALKQFCFNAFSFSQWLESLVSNLTSSAFFRLEYLLSSARYEWPGLSIDYKSGNSFK